jgi:hypothetical protein
MQGRNSNEDELTEDEIARRKLGPRSVPGGEDSAKMTPQQKKNLPKEGEFDGHVASFCGRPKAGYVRLPLLLADQQFYSSLAINFGRAPGAMVLRLK